MGWKQDKGLVLFTPSRRVGGYRLGFIVTWSWAGRGLLSQHLSMLSVRSDRTFAPLPVSAHRSSAVCFCGIPLTIPALGVTQQAWPLRSPDFPQSNRARFWRPTLRPERFTSWWSLGRFCSAWWCCCSSPIPSIWFKTVVWRCLLRILCCTWRWCPVRVRPCSVSPAWSISARCCFSLFCKELLHCYDWSY